MQTLKHISLFTMNHFKQLKRKWYSLPLLLISPVIMMLMIALLILGFLNTEEQKSIHVGLIDLDDSQETQMITNIMENSKEIGNFIEIKNLSKREAKRQLSENHLSAYITFPKAFTEKLYTGDAIDLKVTGNPNKTTESKLVHTLFQSISRHINSSQANILTIDNYAKKLDITDLERNEITREQFISFLLFTIGKNKNISEETVDNTTSSSPLKYLSIASWFIIISIWLFVIYQFLYQDDTKRLKERMKLYGVTTFQQIIAKIIVSMITTLVLQ